MNVTGKRMTSRGVTRLGKVSGMRYTALRPKQRLKELNKAALRFWINLIKKQSSAKKEVFGIFTES